MMSTAPPLSLTHEQASHLQAYLQTFRRWVFATLAPSAERNMTLRTLQAVQGKLVALHDQKQAWLTLVLTAEEMTVLKMSLNDLLVISAREPASHERNATLADLAALKALLERLPQDWGTERAF